jgi:hypothetical protein
VEAMKDTSSMAAFIEAEEEEEEVSSSMILQEG